MLTLFRITPSKTIRLLPLLAITLLCLFSACETEPPCVHHDLKSFSICTPPTWTLAETNADSPAGHFTDKELRVDFDLCPSADPLTDFEGTAYVKRTVITVDGREGKKLDLLMSSPLPVKFIGVHIPEVHTSSKDSIKFTLLAHTKNRELLPQVEKAIGTLKFK